MSLRFHLSSSQSVTEQVDTGMNKLFEMIIAFAVILFGLAVGVQSNEEVIDCFSCSLVTDGLGHVISGDPSCAYDKTPEDHLIQPCPSWDGMYGVCGMQFGRMRFHESVLEFTYRRCIIQNKLDLTCTTASDPTPPNPYKNTTCYCYRNGCDPMKNEGSLEKTTKPPPSKSLSFKCQPPELIVFVVLLLIGLLLY